MNPTGTSSSPFSSSGRRRTQPGYAAILTGPYRGSDAFWEVKRLIRKDKKRLAAMAEVEKAEMPLIIAELLREQAITMVDLAQFSPGLRKRVKGICTIEERKDSPF